jgi:hypothetical protein
VNLIPPFITAVQDAVKVGSHQTFPEDDGLINIMLK